MIEFNGITWLYEVDALLRSIKVGIFFSLFALTILTFLCGFRVVEFLLMGVLHEHQKHDYSSSY